MKQVTIQDVLKHLEKGGGILAEEPENHAAAALKPVIAELGRIAEKDSPTVNVDLDALTGVLEGLAQAINKRPQGSTPINFAPVVRELQKMHTKPAYEFDIERDDRGRIKKVLANPVVVK